MRKFCHFNEKRPSEDSRWGGGGGGKATILFLPFGLGQGVMVIGQKF